MVSPDQRKSVYDSDIIYATNNELGFDYLRDNMAYSTDQKCQTSLNYAIIDEVDSVLIDEARTPLIISGSNNKTNNTYSSINKIIRKFLSDNNTNYYNLEEKQKSVSLTEEGQSVIENLLLSTNLIQSSSDI